MIEVKKEGILFSKTDMEFENEGVLNPAAIREGDSVHLLYRAVRTGNHSTIGYCRMDGPLTIAERWDKPVLVPEFGYESQGVEDPRIVKIDDLYYMTYTGYDGINALGALAVSRDLRKFRKRGIIVPVISFEEFVLITESVGKLHKKYHHPHTFYYPEADPEIKMLLWDKNVMFFPRKINGKLVFLHRIRPGIQIVSVKTLKDLTQEFWRDYLLNLHDHILLEPVSENESHYIGSGCPPIETRQGWILIYHNVEVTDKGRVYSAFAALLDLNNPARVIGRLPYALFSPEFEWEINGYVNNVVFPTGTSLFGDTLFIYYGAADERVACASVNLPGLLGELLTYSIKNET